MKPTFNTAEMSKTLQEIVSLHERIDTATDITTYDFAALEHKANDLLDMAVNLLVYTKTLRDEDPYVGGIAPCASAPLIPSEEIPF